MSDKGSTSEQAKKTCAECSSTFKSSTELRTHRFDAHNLIAFVEYCGVTSQMNADEQGNFVCFHCESSVRGYKQLKQHFSRKHKSLAVFNQESSLKRGFSFQEGVEQSFHQQYKRTKSEHLAKGIAMQPFCFDVTLDNGNSFRSFGMLNEDSADFLKKHVTCKQSTPTVRFHAEKKERNKLSDGDMLRLVENSKYPGLVDVLGPYVPMNAQIEELLSGNNITSISKLFPGSLIITNDFLLLLVTCEVYARDGSVDLHAEKTGASFPKKLDAKKRQYATIKLCTITESDGGAALHKLIIGCKKFNVLVTGSLLVSKSHNEVKFGPQCHKTVLESDLNFASIFVRGDAVNEMMESEKSTTTAAPNAVAQACRQLNSGFDHRSTFFGYRVNLFENVLRQPATLFTLCYLPNVGYGSSCNNSCRNISLFFRLVVECLGGQRSIGEISANFSNIENDTLKSLVESCDKEDADILNVLRSTKGVSAMAQGTSSYLTSANKKLSDDTESYLASLFTS